MITRNTDYSIQRLRGLSTDTKPVNVPNGSEYREMDTGKDFMYDEASGDWKEQPKKGGGGGDNRFIVTCTPTAQDYSGTMDKTQTEIDDAWNSGKSIWFIVGGSVAPMVLRDEGPDGNSYSTYTINKAMNALIVATTYHHSNSYGTKIYQLTPMGG